MANKSSNIEERIKRQRQRRRAKADEAEEEKPKRRRTSTSSSSRKRPAKQPAKKQPARKRPAKKAEKASTGERSHIAAHLSPELKAAVATLAESRDKSQSAFLRDLAQGAVNNEVRKLKRANKQVPRALKAAVEE